MTYPGKFRIPPQFDPDDICPNTGERHKPDWNSITLESDGGEWYVDVNCSDCGRSGCVGSSETLSEAITW